MPLTPNWLTAKLLLALVSTMILGSDLTGLTTLFHSLTVLRAFRLPLHWLTTFVHPVIYVKVLPAGHFI
jgi:hypothetical protein